MLVKHAPVKGCGILPEESCYLPRELTVNCGGQPVNSAKSRNFDVTNIHLKLAMATGYSGTPLVNKLGIKPGQRIMLVHPPPEYFAWIQTPLSGQLCKQNEIPELVHLFAKNNKEFVAEMKKLERVIKKNTSVIIWVSWYKKSAGITTDLTEDVIRQYALLNGLVDVKVCAVTDIWSGLKLVVPLKKR